MDKFIRFLKFMPLILRRIVHVLSHLFCDVDCNGEALMLCVQQKGHVCHHNGSHRTCFNNTIYKRNAAEYSKRRKFGRVEIDKDFDFSKEDYSEELE